MIRRLKNFWYEVKEIWHDYRSLYWGWEQGSSEVYVGRARYENMDDALDAIEEKNG